MCLCNYTDIILVFEKSEGTQGTYIVTFIVPLIPQTNRDL